jgi:diguanylate cyclase (GGDEF)-like protein
VQSADNRDVGPSPPPHLHEPVDPSDVRFWRRSQRAGALTSVIASIYVLAYLAWTWDGPHRTLLAIVGVVALLSSIALVKLPLLRIFQSRWRDPFFLSWSAGLLGMIVLGTELDGGPTSALAPMYFLPIVFATLAYPARPMVVVSVAVVVTYVIVAVLDRSDGPATFVFAATLITSAVLCAWQSQLHHHQREELARVSRADPLTDCLNRRGFEERLAAELARAVRYGHQTSLLLIDLDHFKAVNDRDGHQAGDELLQWTVTRISASLRPMDSVGRLGGDEFAVVLPEADAAEAAEVAARIEEAQAQRAPASSGAATFPADGRRAEQLHASADVRLYAAKAARPPIVNGAR